MRSARSERAIDRRTRVALAAVALLAAACSSSSSDEDEDEGEAGEPDGDLASSAGDDGAERAVEVTPPDPDGPRLALSLFGRYGDPVFGAIGLPAISKDRRRVAYPHQLQDGGRGNPNLTLVIRRVADNRQIESFEILPVEPRWKPEREAAVRLRLEAANARLDAGSWAPMTGPDYEGTELLGGGATLEIGSLLLRARRGRLEIARGGRTRWNRDIGRWLGVEDEPGCDFRPELGEAWAEGRAVLVRIDFSAAPGCWREPVWRVVKLP